MIEAICNAARPTCPPHIGRHSVLKRRTQPFGYSCLECARLKDVSIAAYAARCHVCWPQICLGFVMLHPISLAARHRPSMDAERRRPGIQSRPKGWRRCTRCRSRRTIGGHIPHGCQTCVLVGVVAGIASGLTCGRATTGRRAFARLADPGATM